MKYKYANNDKTILNIFIDGSLRKCIQRITPEILEDEGITLDDIEIFQTDEEKAALELSQGMDAINQNTSAKMASFEVEALGLTFDFSERSKNNFDALLGRLEAPASKLTGLSWRHKGSRDAVEYNVEQANEIAYAVLLKLGAIDAEAQAAKKELES